MAIKFDATNGRNKYKWIFKLEFDDSFFVLVNRIGFGLSKIIFVAIKIGKIQLIDGQIKYFSHSAIIFGIAMASGDFRKWEKNSSKILTVRMKNASRTCVLTLSVSSNNLFFCCSYPFEMQWMHREKKKPPTTRRCMRSASARRPCIVRASVQSHYSSIAIICRFHMAWHYFDASMIMILLGLPCACCMFLRLGVCVCIFFFFVYFVSYFILSLLAFWFL